MGKLLEEIRTLSVEARLDLIDEIWATFEQSDSTLTVSENEKQWIKERLEAHQATPNEGSNWTDMKARLLAKR